MGAGLSSTLPPLHCPSLPAYLVRRGCSLGIAAGDTGRVAVELVAAGGVVLEGWTGPLFGATRRPGISFKNASHIGDSSIR